MSPVPGSKARMRAGDAVAWTGPVALQARPVQEACSFTDHWMLALPFKLNADRRHHIPKQKRKVVNSAAYDVALRQRSSLTVWFTEEAVAGC